MSILFSSEVSEEKKSINKSVKDYKTIKQLGIIFTILLMLAISLILLLFKFIVITVEPGEVGVIWKRFEGGTVLDRIKGEGTHIIFPWNKIYRYDIRYKTINDELDILTINGLTVNVEYAFRYAPDRDFIGLLHKTIGPNYVESILVPEIKSTIRKIISQYTPEQIYTDQVTIIKQINLEGQRRTSDRYINIDDVLVKKIELPPNIKEAIEAKLREQQRFQEYVFRISKEEQEKKRKIIEAEGIREFQKLVSSNLDDKYLKWKGIAVTGELAQSENSKVIIIGAGEGGLPVILGNDTK